MNQPDDLRELLKTLARWANRARFKLDPLGGELPTGGDTCRVTSMLAKDVDENPFGQLYLMACKILGFPQAYWPAGLPEAAKEVTELRDFLRPIEKHYGENQTTKGLKRIEEIVESILDWNAMLAKETLILVPELPKTLPVGLSQPYDGGDFVFCVDEKVKVSPALQDALKAYLDDEPSIDVGASDPYQIQTRLKKLILKLMNGGFQPPPKRWPRGEQKKTGNVVYFDSPKGK